MQDHESGGHEPTEEELERRLQALLGSGPDLGEVSLPKVSDIPPDDEVETKFKAISDRLDEAQAKRKLPDVPEWNYKRPKSNRGNSSDPSNYRGLGIGISIGYTLVGCMVLGWGIGWLIDRQSGGNSYQAFMALGGCIVGIGMAFWLMNRGGSQ